MTKPGMDKGAKEKIEVDDEWVACWICEEMFKRSRGTLRYCSVCDRGFCEAEHGKFARAKNGQNRGICIICLDKESEAK